MSSLSWFLSSTRAPARRALQHAAMETLESRQMLAFSVGVNFQAQSTTNTPPGYLGDFGRGHSLQADGYFYGWNKDNKANGTDRQSTKSPDNRYDTFNKLSSTGWWAIAVPNGRYEVHLVAGDAHRYDSVYKINVEGELGLSGTPNSSNRWVEGTTTVDVTDGALTLTSAGGAVNNKVCFIDIESIDVDEEPPPPPPPTETSPVAPDDFLATAINSSQITLEWDDNAGNETGFKIERKQGDNGTWSQIKIVGANVEGYLDSGLPASTQYYYRVRAYNGVGNSGFSNTDGSTTKPDAGLPSTTISWSTKASNPLKRAEAGGGVVNGKLYVLGGLYLDTDGDILATRRADVYNPATNRWTRLRDMPEKLTHAQGVVDGNNIWFAGGYVGDHPGPGSSHVWKYNTTNDTWTSIVDLPADRGAGGSALIGRELHFFGGMNETRDEESGDHWSLNIDNPNAQWVRRASLLNPRNHTAGAAVNGVLYALGGQHGQEEEQDAQNDIERYDPVANRWTKVADLPAGRSHHASSTFVIGNTLIIVGGETGHGQNMRQVTAWNPSTNKFTELTKLPAARSTQVAGVLPDGRIIASTGNAPSPVSTTWIGKFV